VRAKLQRGWPLDYLDRKYIAPDWNKVYPALGYPPVRSTEDMRSYNIIINDFTQMLEPRDVMELIWTKEAVDAVWKANRLAREKSSSRVGSRYYQALDIAQSREIKRRDNALRQIARWRDGLGGKVRALPDKFLAESALLKRYGIVQSFVGAANDETGREDMEAAPPRGPAGEAADASQPVPLSDEPATAAPQLASAGAAVEAVPPFAPAGENAGGASPLRASDQAAEAAPPVASSGGAAEASEAAPTTCGSNNEKRNRLSAFWQNEPKVSPSERQIKRWLAPMHHGLPAANGKER
jgi:hypothetical protein